MSSSQLSGGAIPKPLPEDDDDVSWALQTAAVQWGRGAHQDAIVWLRRAAESAIENASWSRAADLNATASRLEKQLTRTSGQSGPSGFPSAPPRDAILPAFPVPATSIPPAPGPARRQTTTGYSSLPPLPSRSFSSQAPSASGRGRSSVVIDVDDGEVELSDDEIRALETDSLDVGQSPSGQPGIDIPSGARPSWMVGQRSSSMEPIAPALPAFSLDSSRPSSPSSNPPPELPTTVRRSSVTSAQPGPLPTAPRQRGPLPNPAPSQSRAPDRSSASSLPSFPLDNPSSLPPVSKWPQMGSGGTSNLPPTPGLPNLDAIPPSRPFVDDGEDGAPGVEDHELEMQPISDPMRDEQGLLIHATDADLEPLELAEEYRPRHEQSLPAEPVDDLELLDLESSRNPEVRVSTPAPLQRLNVRATGRGVAKQRIPSAPLPPALPTNRSLSSAPRIPRARPATSLPSTTPPSARSPALESSRAQASGHARSGSVSPIEPRMPIRTLSSYGARLDFSSKGDDPAAQDRQASSSTTAAISSAPAPSGSYPPTERRMEAASATSMPPPNSARSIEPEDLPTVTSPSLSRVAAEVRSRPTEDRLDPRDSEPREHPAEGPRAPATDVPPKRPSYDFSHLLSERPEPLVPARPPEAPPARPLLPHEERRRLSFKFEEHKASDRAPSAQAPGQRYGRSNSDQAYVPDVPGTNDVPEEPLAVLPPVAVRPSAEPRATNEEDVVISGVRLAEVRGLSDLPNSAHRLLARTARIEALCTGEEASFFSVALVLEGWVALMPAIADTACATAVVGEVVFTEGSLADGLMLRVVAGQDDVVVATWDAAAIAEATKDCPWIADDLRLLADGFQALAGACLGPLGDRLDDSLRSIVTSRCEIRTLLPGEQLCAAGKPVPGMHIIGGGEIELVDDSSRVAKTFGTGEFLYAPQVLAGGVAPFAARAGNKGALVLFAPRMSAHELLVSVPPLLEILAE